MLNEIQKMTIRALVKKGADKDAEIKKLTAGFVGTSESEIRKYWEDFSGSSSASAEPKNQKAASAPATGNSRGKRLWTDNMIEQLVDLREHGETAARIAEMMGLDVKQVKNKLDRLPEHFKPQVQHKVSRLPETEIPVAQDLSDEGLDPYSVSAVNAQTHSVICPHCGRSVPSDYDSFLSQEDADRYALEHCECQKEHTPATAPACPIDIPEALYRIAQMVRDDFCGEITDIYASKSERKATCTFDYDGVLYELKLEVLK